MRTEKLSDRLIAISPDCLSLNQVRDVRAAIKIVKAWEDAHARELEEYKCLKAKLEGKQ